MRIMLTAALGASAVVMVAASAAAQQIVPQPVSMTRGTGHFTITPRTVIWTDRSSAAVAHQLARTRKRGTPASSEQDDSTT